MSEPGSPAEHVLQPATQARKAAREFAAASGEARAAALTYAPCTSALLSGEPFGDDWRTQRTMIYTILCYPYVYD